MRKLIILALLLCHSILVFSQEEENLGVLVADSTWTKEVIKFPLGFAREIAYEGYEDIRFAKGWAKNESSEFWTYTFAWHIKGIQKPSAKDLKWYLKLYFDGLMLPYNNDKLKIPAATVGFSKNTSSKDDYDFSGSIDTYDKFHSKKRIILNYTIKSSFCEEKKTSTIVFRFSTKDFKHNVWKKFNEVKLRDDICDNKF